MEWFFESVVQECSQTSWPYQRRRSRSERVRRQAKLVHRPVISVVSDKGRYGQFGHRPAAAADPGRKCPRVSTVPIAPHGGSRIVEANVLYHSLPESTAAGVRSRRKGTRSAPGDCKRNRMTPDKYCLLAQPRPDLLRNAADGPERRTNSPGIGVFSPTSGLALVLVRAPSQHPKLGLPSINSSGRDYLE
jgi:hypothetical protein